MPNWQPNWQDVQWNQAAADEAIGALRHAAADLESSAHQRQQQVAAMLSEWRGIHRTTFDRELEAIVRQAQRLADEYRDAANRIQRAAHQAAADQAHRTRERERWSREKAEEDRRQCEEQERRRREEEARRQAERQTT